MIFFEYRTKVSKGKDTYYPYLDRIVVVQFRRGSNEIYWRTAMRVLDFSHGNFLQKKFIKVWMQKNLISRKPCPRGIPLQKKEDIVKKKLCPMMEINRRAFWEKLPIANVVDLVDGYED